MDTPYNGVNVYVASWRDPALARSLATRLAESCWAARTATRAGYVPLEIAVATAVEAGADAARPAVCIADISDNPGGGALGNTTFLLRALLDAGARGVVLGPFWEPELAARAHAAGVGAVLDAELNAARVTEYSASLPVQARVAALHPGRIRLGRGVGDGVELDHGPMAALEIGGVTLIVTTIAYQALSTAQFSELGVDLEAVRCFVLKSRGHFRAAFEGLIARERILEVAVPGYTTPALDSVLLRNVQRPVYPLDPAMEWCAGDEVRVHVRGRATPLVREYRS
jgi:microcystin degradation protein MlrC